MGYLAKNAQEEALKSIARQMTYTNHMNLARELYELGAMTKEEYIEKLKTLLKFA